MDHRGNTVPQLQCNSCIRGCDKYQNFQWAPPNGQCQESFLQDGKGFPRYHLQGVSLVHLSFGPCSGDVGPGYCHVRSSVNGHEAYFFTDQALCYHTSCPPLCCLSVAIWIFLPVPTSLRFLYRFRRWSSFFASVQQWQLPQKWPGSPHVRHAGCWWAVGVVGDDGPSRMSLRSLAGAKRASQPPYPLPPAWGLD
jgi:hypothetical protein